MRSKLRKKPGKLAGIAGDGSGQILRTFADTNGDNIVDQWSYFKDGIEVYRDIDANFNGKADQIAAQHGRFPLGTR